jgi:hypothetical protein
MRSKRLYSPAYSVKYDVNEQQPPKVSVVVGREHIVSLHSLALNTTRPKTEIPTEKCVI